MPKARKRAWCLTLNNPTDEEIASFCLLGPKKGVRGIFALEVGEHGTPHIQGFVRWHSAKSLSAVKKILGSSRWHLEESRGTDFENYVYCRKDGQIVHSFGPEPLEEGDDPWTVIKHMVQQGDDDFTIIERFPMIAMRCQTAIAKYRQICRKRAARWRDVTTTYIWGPTGTGKTRSVLYDDEGNYRYDVFRVTNPKHPWDGYDGQPIVLFEEFRSQFPCRDMLNWLDGHPIELPARYADRFANFTEVYIVSNWDLDEQYENVQYSSPATWKAFLRRITEVKYLGHED